MTNGLPAVDYLARWAAQGGGRTQRNRFDATVVPFTDLIRSQLGRHSLDPLVRCPYDPMIRATLAGAIDRAAQADARFDRRVGDMLKLLSSSAGGTPSRAGGSSNTAAKLTMLVAVVGAIVLAVLWSSLR